jgi:GDP/UDP-N,N'-diacetylbacillosamine 2-epimerase (hydrolysing)
MKTLKKKRIMVVTGSRAEFGLLVPLLGQLKQQKQISFSLLVTGAHLSPQFGLTYKEIVKSHFKIAYKIPMLSGNNTDHTIVLSMAEELRGIAKVFKKLRPDLLLLLGDRYELLPPAIAAMIYRIPIAHLFGGEITGGAYDDAIRHALTKLSHLHFVANEKYRQRVIQMGEAPDRVFVCGALGLENIGKMKLLDVPQIERMTNIRFRQLNILVTYHPTTLKKNSCRLEFQEVLKALDRHSKTTIIFTMPNADSESYIIRRMIDKYVRKHRSHCYVFENLGTLLYLSVLSKVNFVLGNSSSGIVEAPALQTPTINIGDRQKGRMQGDSIINCLPDATAISHAIRKVQSSSYLKQLTYTNPYGDGNTSKRIIAVLKRTDFKKLIQKRFYDFH